MTGGEKKRSGERFEEPRIGVIRFSESEIATDVLTESTPYNLFDSDDDMGEDNFQSDR